MAQEPALSDIERCDRFRGALVGCGIGDAMGSPVEGVPPRVIAERNGRITGYLPRPDGTVSGRITDDTQLTLCIAASIVESGGIDPAELAQRFDAWLYIGRGVGRATRAAIMRIREGIPWERAGVDSAGNGAAMRAAPIGLLHPSDLDRLRRDARLSAMVTHNDPAAIASTTAQAAAVAWLVRQPSGSVTIDGFLGAITESLDGVEDIPYPMRHQHTERTLRQCIEQAAGLVGRPAHEAFAVTHNGAFVLESLPAAIWCFLTHLDDPREAIIAAVNGGYDADTVAAMTGALAGAYHGASSFPTEWVWPLEFADGLAGWADRLLTTTGTQTVLEPVQTNRSLGTEGWALLEFDDLPYPSVEHAFRSITAIDPDDAYRIRVAPTPLDARRAASAVVLDTGAWERREDLMADLLRKRYSSDPAAARWLAEANPVEIRQFTTPDIDGVGEALLRIRGRYTDA